MKVLISSVKAYVIFWTGLQSSILFSHNQSLSCFHHHFFLLNLSCSSSQFVCWEKNPKPNLLFSKHLVSCITSSALYILPCFNIALFLSPFYRLWYQSLCLLSVCLSLSVCLFVSLSVSVYLSVCLSLSPPLISCLFVCMYVCIRGVTISRLYRLSRYAPVNRYRDPPAEWIAIFFSLMLFIV